MRKGLIFSFITAMLLMCPTGVLADSPTPEPETEQIEDESTPQAARRNQDSVMLFAFLAAGVVVIAAAVMSKSQNLSLFVNHVDYNGDGSYTVTWGYKNPKHSKIKYNKEEAGLKVKKGTAIVLKKAEPTEFEPGVHKDAIITVINDETEIEWIAGNQKVGVNGKMIKIERRNEDEDYKQV